MPSFERLTYLTLCRSFLCLAILLMVQTIGLAQEPREIATAETAPQPMWWGAQYDGNAALLVCINSQVVTSSGNSGAGESPPLLVTRRCKTIRENNSHQPNKQR